MSHHPPKPQKPARVAVPVAVPPEGDSAWHMEQYRRAAKISVLLIIALLISMTTNIAQALLAAKPLYFSVDSDLRLTKLTPLEEPTLTQGGLLNWTAETVVDTVTLDFKNFRKSLMAQRPNFTDAAFEQLVGALKSSGMLELVEKKRLVSSATLERAAVITGGPAVVDGRLTWKIEFPIVLSLESSRGVENTQKMLATVLVQRVPTTEHPRGIKINQLILK